jgi:imidazole glycerol-phosphate synthase subunit HisF
MLRQRVITVLTFNDGVLFRTKLFTPDYRYTQSFVDAWSIDEIVLLDISRPERRTAEYFASVVSDFSKKCFVPLCVGGGVRSLDDFKRYLDLGGDKISVNTAVIDDPELITRAAERFGSQCVVASIDARKEDDDYRVYKNCGRERTEWRPVDLARRAEDLGAGEILLTSIDRDGSLEGYDNELNARVVRAVGIPVIVCGGAGKWQDFVDGIRIGGADAVATTNIYHFTETSIKSAKQYLLKQGLNVRA